MMPDGTGGPAPDAGSGFALGSQMYRRHLDDERMPIEFELLGRSWTLLSGVFAPVYAPGTEITDWLPLPARGGTFLEMGSGTGVTAVTAALSGCRVTALDITSAAVENTRLNAVRHGVADRVDVRQSDLFDALADDERFDVIFWNSNFALAPADFVLETDLARAFFDPGYETHRRFFAQGPSHLNNGGRLLLGFSSDIGSWTELHAACSAAGLVADVIRAQQLQSEPIEFQLVELRPAGTAQRAPISPWGKAVPHGAAWPYHKHQIDNTRSMVSHEHPPSRSTTPPRGRSGRAR